MIGLVTVNYNNAELTRALIASIMDGPDAGHFAIVVVDNASREDDRSELALIAKAYPAVEFIFSEDNLGYFRGLNLGIAHLRARPDKPETIVIGNNDLEFPVDFHAALVAARESSLAAHPVIAPDIVTPEGRHQNPHVIHGVSRLRMAVWTVYYSHYAIARAVHRLAFILRPLSERRDYLEHRKPGVISQGYGACYVLTPRFFEHYEELWAPTFLMGEEFFLAKQVAAGGMSTFYDPSIRVVHRDHSSVGLLPDRKVWEICRTSHKIYMEYYQRYG